MFVTKRAVAVNFVENDSVYIHGKINGIPRKRHNRIIRAFKCSFSKTDADKCDSIRSNYKTALTKLIGNPILWNAENQITGDIMHLIGDSKQKKLDSLKSSITRSSSRKTPWGTGFNQVKGQDLFGKFKDGKLHDVDII